MGTISGNERRRVERKDRDDLSMTLNDKGRQLSEVQVRDVSPLGFGIYVGGDIQPGGTVSFQLRSGIESVSGSARVVWAEAFHMGFRVGLEVTGMGWFGRRRLAKLLKSDGKGGGGGFIDAVLVILALVVGGLVAADLYFKR
ncbi:MAG: PilZ domain-containing protein [Elusimicrobia bacterium]|nr:PilZ domain-containing protein [Elusimicrobiota bacterium]